MNIVVPDINEICGRTAGKWNVPPHYVVRAFAIRAGYQTEDREVCRSGWYLGHYEDHFHKLQDELEAETGANAEALCVIGDEAFAEFCSLLAQSVLTPK